MRQAGYGKIIMMGSMQAHSGAPSRAAYIASKTGLVGLTRALGVEWARHGINVNILSPGYFETDIVKHQIEIGQLNLTAIERRTPMGRIGRMEDLTGPAIFLASPDSDFMCGQALIIDGGWLAYGFCRCDACPSNVVIALRIGCWKEGNTKCRKTFVLLSCQATVSVREVVGQAVRVLETVQARAGDFTLDMVNLPWGTDYYRQTGSLVPGDFLDVLRGFDAILLGALGDPGACPIILPWRPSSGFARPSTSTPIFGPRSSPRLALCVGRQGPRTHRPDRTP